MKKIISVVIIVVVCALFVSCKDKNIEASSILNPSEPMNGTPMTLDDVRELAKKGNSLLFADFKNFKGMNVSSHSNGYLMVYGVEEGYRLIVEPESDNKQIQRSNLESIWESGGSGIDIRYSDVDEFIRNHPSHAALTIDKMSAIAQAHSNREVTLIELDWWEYADEFPNHCKDPAKQALRESLDAIDEPLELFMDTDGLFIAVSRKNGAVYICDTETNENPTWKPYQ